MLPNPGKGGWGTIIKAGKLVKEISGGYRLTTNNRMELISVIKALQFLNNNTNSKSFKINVYSDSQYVINSFNNNWISGWIKNGFKKNEDLWKQLLNEINNHEITWIWVRGHNGNVENERCDELAVKARQGDKLEIDYIYENLNI